jgi:dihydroorotase
MRTAAADTFQVSSPLSTDIYDRELVFIETVVRPLIPDMPRTLKIVLEHIDHVSSFIIQSERHVGRRDASAFILPADIKTPSTSFGSSKFFAGTDSALHAT